MQEFSGKGTAFSQRAIETHLLVVLWKPAAPSAWFLANNIIALEKVTSKRTDTITASLTRTDLLLKG